MYVLDIKTEMQIIITIVISFGFSFCHYHIENILHKSFKYTFNCLQFITPQTFPSILMVCPVRFYNFEMPRLVCIVRVTFIKCWFLALNVNTNTFSKLSVKDLTLVITTLITSTKFPWPIHCSWCTPSYN